MWLGPVSLVKPCLRLHHYIRLHCILVEITLMPCPFLPRPRHPTLISRNVPKRNWNWNVKRASPLLGVFTPRSQRCDERQTNKGAERGHGVPIEWRNPTWVEVSRGQTFSGRCWWSFQWLPKDYMVKWVIRRLGLKPSVLCLHGSACMRSSKCFCSRQQGFSPTTFFCP